MIFIKYILLISVFIASSGIGILFSKKSKNRVLELREVKNALNIIENKMKFTYEPLEEIFKFVSENSKNNISKIFKDASINIKKFSAKEAWNNSINNYKENLFINNEDTNIILGLGNSIGKTNLEGQISEIELTLNFLDTQIIKAEDERKKNEKMYKSLGSIIGLAIVIILC